uniref:ubiquinol-cytochrome-c reductase complex assembly factor 3 n=1 Tax=Pristiophorus japonicus TaxID=55135 RepID=UPI00398EEF35
MRARMAVAGALLVAAAGGLSWVLAGPSEQRRRDIAQHLPESSRAQLESSRRRNALVMEVIKESAKTGENMTRKTDWNKPSRSDS